MRQHPGSHAAGSVAMWERLSNTYQPSHVNQVTGSKHTNLTSALHAAAFRRSGKPSRQLQVTHQPVSMQVAPEAGSVEAVQVHLQPRQGRHRGVRQFQHPSGPGPPTTYAASGIWWETQAASGLWQQAQSSKWLVEKSTSSTRLTELFCAGRSPKCREGLRRISVGRWVMQVVKKGSSGCELATDPGQHTG